MLLILGAVNIATGIATGAAGAPQPVAGRGRPALALVYAAIGSELREYELNVASARLSELVSVRLPQDIQAGCVASSGRYVYVAWSDGTNRSPGSRHGLSTFRIDPVSKRLLSVGEPVPLSSRPIYVSTDRSARHLLIAYTVPSGVTIHPIASDGRAGAATPQGKLSVGVYAHEILVAPTNRMAILVSRGNLAAAGRPEDPGALEFIDYQDGVLKLKSTFAPDRGIGFHPRYVDFDPQRRWLFVSLSQRNALGVYALRPGTGAELLFERRSLAEGVHGGSGQLTGTVHVHPSGDTVYMVNRSLGAAGMDGKQVYAGGENDIAVFRINRRTAEPVLIQNVATRGMVPGEFAFDPAGRILVLANMEHGYVRDGHTLRAVPPSLVLFRVRHDGELDFVRKYAVVSGNHSLFWMGVGRVP